MEKIVKIKPKQITGKQLNKLYHLSNDIDSMTKIGDLISGKADMSDLFQFHDWKIRYQDESKNVSFENQVYVFVLLLTSPDNKVYIYKGKSSKANYIPFLDDQKWKL